MKLIIDLSQTPTLLKLRGTSPASAVSGSLCGTSFLSESLLGEIDKMLKKNGLEIADIEKVEVVPDEKSLVGTRIAKAVALGLKTKLPK